jgi:glycosyltransferase 2 family protein
MKRLFSVLFLVLRRLAPWFAIAAVTLALLPRSAELGAAWNRLPTICLVSALALSLSYRLLNAGGSVWILESLRQRIGFFAGTRLWLISEALRWLPGSVWNFFSRVDGTVRLGVPLGIASLSVLVELLTTIFSWMVVALLGLYGSGFGFYLWSKYAVYLAVAVSLGFACGCLAFYFWPVLKRQTQLRPVTQRVSALFAVHPDFRILGRTALFYVLMNILNGLGFWVILVGMGYGETISFTAAVGANAVGWLIGFFAIGIPGGIGVREAGSALVLASLMPWQEAAMAAILWRLALVAAELLSLLCCLVSYYNYRNAVKFDSGRTLRSMNTW